MDSMHAADFACRQGLRRGTAGLLAGLLYVATVPTAHAAGTPAGTVIESSATVSFDLAGTPGTVVSNTASLLVDERIDVVATLQSPQLLVAPGDTSRALLFTVTNIGNGTESFSLLIDNLIAGDNFDPVEAVPSIYFDTDASGDLTVADQPYVPGSNDPSLAADASIDVFLVNDIPAGVANGDIGRTQLQASSTTATGAPGTVASGGGDGGVNAVVGSSGGAAAVDGEYLVSDILVTVAKSQLVSNPYGGSEPVPGATITYTLTIDVVGTGTATGSDLADPIPTYTTFVPGSLTLNGAGLTDAVDADAGELDTSGAPTVVVRLGDLTLADGTQTVTFAVTID